MTDEQSQVMQGLHVSSIGPFGRGWFEALIVPLVGLVNTDSVHASTPIS